MRLGNQRPSPQVPETLKEHVAADHAQHHDVSDRDREVGSAERPQDLDDLNADPAARQASHQQGDAQLDINVSQPEVRPRPGRRPRNDLAGVRSGSHRGRNADHHQDGREQEPSTDSKHAGKETDQGAHSHQNQERDAHSSYGKKYPHDGLKTSYS